MDYVKRVAGFIRSVNTDDDWAKSICILASDIIENLVSENVSLRTELQEVKSKYDKLKEESPKAGDIVDLHANIFDKVEVFHNCTVEVLTNTVTGDVDVGWYPEGSSPYEDEEDEEDEGLE